MKSLIFLLILVISTTLISAQEQELKNRSETKAEKNELQAELIKNLLDNQTFTFVPNQVIMKDKTVLN